MMIRKRGGEMAQQGQWPDENQQPNPTAANPQPANHRGSRFSALLQTLPLPGCLHHQFTLTGLNLERFLNTLQKEGIALVSARRVDRRTLRCICRSADLDTITTIAREKGWRMEKARPVGLGARLRRWFSRPGLVIGTVLATVLLTVAMRFIWVIRIVDAGPYQADIMSFLAQEGYRCGMRKEQTDAATLSLLLQRRYPDVAWFRVYVNNVTLVVECTQGVPAPELPDAQPCDLLAVRDGVVQSVQVYGGTALVRPGDLVRRGQVLIRGEEQGADGEMVPAAARGRVIARCWQEETVRVSMQETLSEETGRSETHWQLCTPWFCWPKTLESPDYLTYHLYLTDTPVAGSFFPVWQREAEYREVALTRVMRPVAEAKAEAEAAALAQLRKTLRGYQLVQTWVETHTKE
ncbi:MAG: sporulation protein YqfD, partial [Clostridia bacterium]|nr:sporulation protein YqfD [Clostridia bacterium]